MERTDRNKLVKCTPTPGPFSLPAFEIKENGEFSGEIEIVKNFSKQKA